MKGFRPGFVGVACSAEPTAERGWRKQKSGEVADWVRVIAGKAKGIGLRTNRSPWLRPTTDRARQVLFDWLGERVVGARVLDLFCGTGALGIEALSRGAREATFVDVRSEALALVRANLAATGLAHSARLVRADVRSALKTRLIRERCFNLVLADPPYEEQESLLVHVLQRVRELLCEGGIFVLERSRRTQLVGEQEGLIVESERSVGDTVFTLMRKEGTEFEAAI